MNSTGTTDCETQASARTGPGINEALLRSEIGFWRELIDACNDKEPTDSVERMQQALALAESRLRELFQSHQDNRKAESAPPGNVYWLDRARD